MISNSPRSFAWSRVPALAIACALRRESLRARLVGELVENAVDDFRLVLGEEGMGNVHIFGDDDAGRHVVPRHELEGSRAENGAQDGIDAGQPPALGELPVDQRIDFKLLAHDALDQIAEELRLCLAELTA